MSGLRGKLLWLAAMPMLLASGGSNNDPARDLAGRYYSQFPDALVSGEKYTGENIVEIVPVAPTAAYFRIHLDFYNGHTCSISGVAKAEARTLVYREPEPLGDRTCVLRISHIGRSLLIDDGDLSCKSYCGARGGLNNVTVPYSSKRQIRYLAKLKSSEQYRDALTEWRTGKAVR